LLVQSRSPEEVSAGLQLLQDSAEHGDVPAMVQLGLLFKGGKYVHRNDNEAFHWFSLLIANCAREPVF